MDLSYESMELALTKSDSADVHFSEHLSHWHERESDSAVATGFGASAAGAAGVSTTGG
jgi:hypothetical protein